MTTPVRKQAMLGLFIGGVELSVRGISDALRQMDVDEVGVGNLVLVRTGEVIPIDGTIESDGAMPENDADRPSKHPCRRGVSTLDRCGARKCD